MKVEIIKMHSKWQELFKVGDIVEMNKKQSIKSKNGLWYSTNEMCKSFSNRCSLSDLFKKVEEL